MRRNSDWAGKAPRAAAMALGMTVLLAGCSGFDSATSAMADGAASTGERIGAPWGGARPAPLAEESPNVQRVRGLAPVRETLQPEPGDVWPAAEAPRATLMNPDQALRGTTGYQPEAPPPPRRRGSAGLPQESSVDETRFTSPPPVAPAMPPARPAARADGQVINTPNGPVVTSGGTDRIQSYNQPGGGTGTVIRDGGMVTITGPDGRVQVVPAPR